MLMHNAKYIQRRCNMQYKIGSLNMKNWSFISKKDKTKIAEIIISEDLDVVALQEILSEGKDVENFVNYELYGWDYRWASPRESSDINKAKELISGDRRGEGYAYLWKKDKFKLAEYTELGKKRVFKPRIVNSLGNDVNVDCSFFARTPYYIRLQPLYGGFFDLRLINIHIYYGANTSSAINKRKLEFDVLTQEIYPQICEIRYGDFRPAYTIAMGDYNLNILSPFVKTTVNREDAYLSEVYIYQDGRRDVKVLTVQSQLTTLKDVGRCPGQMDSPLAENMYANNYDHFTYSPELSKFSSVSYEAIDAVNKYCDGDYSYYRSKISDHLPIAMTIEL